MKRFAFRVDASLKMGTGHVMRCLTLADALRDHGAQCHFLCRSHVGHSMERVDRAGHAVHPLHATGDTSADTPSLSEHAGWLGVDWRTDAEECRDVLDAIRPDWLVVDHYGLDADWETLVRPMSRRLAVIDDLADRPHDCDLLLDQTLGRAPEAYRPLVPERCIVLTGACYALLRPRFPELREASLARRTRHRTPFHVVITMGGVDHLNATGRVLQALHRCSLPADCRVTVVMGASAPWLESVREQARTLPRPTRVLVDVADMAQLLADTDLSIGAAGSTSWERCCLGVPTLMLVLAENQRDTAAALKAAGAAVVVNGSEQTPADIASALEDVLREDRLRSMSQAASHVTDGRGAARLVRHLLDER